MPADAARLVLGTVQLGLDYGVANRTGRPSEQEARRILDAAYDAGVRVLDTARAYGDSEAVIGRWLGGREDVEVITKVGAGDPAAALRESAALLGRRPDGVLAHEPGAWRGLPACVEAGLAGWAGVSVYTPEEMAAAAPEVGAVQAPLSVADRRLRDAGLLDAGVRLFLRSAYLQGVLLMAPEEAPPVLAPAVARWRAACDRHGLRPQVAALQWVKAAAPHAEIVVGAESVEQVRDTVEAWHAQPPPAPVLADLEAAFDGVDERAIDPRTWS